METSYTVTLETNADPSGTLLRIDFAQPASNDRIVVDAQRAISKLSLPGGPLLKFNGPASLPVAMTLCHAVAHRYAAVAVFDPKLGKYVVCVSHDPAMPIGTLLE